MKKVFAFLLAVAMALTAGCAGKEEAPAVTTVPVTVAPGEIYADPFAAYADYYEKSQALYDANLGEFYTLYQQALGAQDPSQRLALMAMAEAKLLSSSVMLPMGTNGGHYAISRIAPGSVPYVQWGDDARRCHDLIITEELISLEHRQEMQTKWQETRGSGNYESWAKSYLKKKGYTVKKTHLRTYTDLPKSWDPLGVSDASSLDVLANTYVGLVEYDAEGRLRPQLARSWSKKVNEDGTVTYTFQLRTDSSWNDYKGMYVARVTADDFVAGLQHMLDARGGKEDLVRGVIVNAAEYLDGTVTDFSQVGVQAVNKTTLTYTLTKDIPYFLTMLGHNIFAPMNREYYISQGGAFGAEHIAAFESDAYLYGTSPDHIAYCGAFIAELEEDTQNLLFRQNLRYWNRSSTNIKSMTWIPEEGSDGLKSYENAVSGLIDETGLNDAAMAKAQTDGLLETHGYVTDCDDASFVGFYNLNRTAYANANDGAASSPKTREDQIRTQAAMHNVHFRRALSMSLDRGSYNAAMVGESRKLVSLRNTFTPAHLFRLEAETTVSLNGTEKTYPAGTAYGVIVQEQLDADGVKVKVWDPETGSADGFDGWYSPENAVAELNIAISELQALGVTVSAENPIRIDYPYLASGSIYVQRAEGCKKSIEAALGGKVTVNLISCYSPEMLAYAGYYCNSGEQMNYDIYDVSGWELQYGDPQNYLDSMLPGKENHGIKALGIF